MLTTSLEPAAMIVIGIRRSEIMQMHFAESKNSFAQRVLGSPLGGACCWPRSIAGHVCRREPTVSVGLKVAEE